MRLKQFFLDKHKGEFIFTILFLIILIVGYYPLWKDQFSLVWNVDGVGQYYPAFIYTGQYLQNFFLGIFRGEWILPTFDLAIGMGEDIIGSLNYYGFGDPLNLLAVFVTKNNSAYLFSFMMILRMWLSGIALQKYFKHFKFDQTLSAFGALCYCFCGFAILGGSMYIEWLSVLIYTPLILLGTEKIIREKKYTLFILAICYGALTGFYYLFMASLILVPYLPIRLLFTTRNLMKTMKGILSSLLAYLLGIFMAMPIFLPAIQSYMNSERAQTSITTILFDKNNYIPDFNFSLVDYFELQGIEPSILHGITVLQFLAVLLLLFLPNNRKKMQAILFCLIALMAFSLPITGYLFNGFGQTNNRWNFIIHLLLASIFVFVMSEYKRKIEDRALVPEGGRIARSNNVWKKRNRNILALGGIITSLNIIFNMFMLFSSLGYDWSEEFVKYEDATSYITSPVNESSMIANDETLHRVGTTLLTGVNGRPENVAMLNRYNGLTYWFSIINKQTQRLVDMSAGGRQSWRSFGFGENINMNSLAGVKYFVTKEPISEVDNYRIIEQVQFNGETWTVYENAGFAGMAYVIDGTGKKMIPSERTEELTSTEAVDISYEEIDGNGIEISNNGNEFSIKFNKSEVSTDNKLVLSVPFYENWRAFVENEEVPIEVTTAGYMSIPIVKGKTNIEFKYSKRTVYVGVAGCLFAMITTVAIAKRKRRNQL